MEKIATGLGQGPEHMIEGHEGYSVASLEARHLREREQILARIQDGPAGPAHRFIVGLKTKSTRSYFASQARWVILPPEMRTT